MPHVTVNSTRGDPFELYYELHGNGEEKLVLLTGFLTSLDIWERQINYFQDKFDKYTVLVVDNRGVGRSGSPSSYTSSEMALDTLELFDHLKWDKVHLVGVSMGGMISLELSCRAPQRLKSLTLCVTHAGGTGRIAPFSGITRMLRSFTIKDVRERAGVLLPILYSDKYLDRLYNENQFKLTREQQQQQLKEQEQKEEGKKEEQEPILTNREYYTNEFVRKASLIRQPTLGAVVGHIRTVMTHHITDRRLKELKDSLVPIMIICGTDDYLVRTSNSFVLKEHLSPIEFLQFDSGHCVNQEFFIEFNQALERHVARGVDHIKTQNGN